MKTVPSSALELAWMLPAYDRYDEEVDPVADPDICCGSAGVYNLLVPQAAGELGPVAGVDEDPGARVELRPGGLRLLLSHNAAVIRRTAPWDFHMTFAGDTHGGRAHRVGSGRSAAAVR